MSKYEVLRPIAFGGRKNVGDVVDLSKEDVERINPEYIVKVGTKINISTTKKDKKDKKDEKDEDKKNEDK